MATTRHLLGQWHGTMLASCRGFDKQFDGLSMTEPVGELGRVVI
jgi:hypothetical protein